MKRIFRRRAADQLPRAGVANLFRGRARGERLPGYRRLPSLGLARLRGRLPWSTPLPPPPPPGPTQQTEQVAAAAAPAPSFKDRSRLRRRLRFLRRTRELGFRDVGGLIFDMRRFARNRPELLNAKLDALHAVDQELRALERILDDRRPFHELREPGISACPRCGALHASEANFCPQCGLQVTGPRAIGELAGAAPVRSAPPPSPAQPISTMPISPSGDKPAAPPVTEPEPAPQQPGVPHRHAPTDDRPRHPDQPREHPPLADAADDDGLAGSEEPTETHLPPPASGGP